MAKILSKFGEQQLVMVNYACGFNQSETGKYFELITMRINSLCRIYLFPQTEFIGSGAGYFTSKFSMSEERIKFISPRAIESVKSIPVKVGDTFTIAKYGCADGGILVPRGRAPFGQHQESRPLAGSKDIPVLNGFLKHNRLRPEPIRYARLDSEHAQSDGKSVNRGLPLLDPARGRDSWC